MLAGCGISVEGFPGQISDTPPDLSGDWRIASDTSGDFVRVKRDGNHFILSGNNEDATQAVQGSVYVYAKQEYLVVQNGRNNPTYVAFRIVQVTPAKVVLQSLNPEHVAALMKAQGLPVTQRKMWLHNEIVVPKTVIAHILDTGANELFANGLVVELGKM